MAELNDKLITYGNLSTFHDNLINDSVTSGNSTWSSEKIASEIQQGGGGGGSTTIENVTYAQLKAKRDNSQLVKGQQYRITDYVTMANSDTTPVSSAEHPFDLIVTAIDVNKLSETGVKVAHCANDDYFVPQPLRYYIDEGDAYMRNLEGSIVIDGTTYYKWYCEDSGGGSSRFYILTTQSSYSNTSDGEDENGEYYYTSYPYAGFLNEDEEIVGDYDSWERKHKCVIKTEERDGQTYLLIGDIFLQETETYQISYEPKLNAWEVKYCLDNDKSRFDWAQEGDEGTHLPAMKVVTEPITTTYYKWLGTNKGDEDWEVYYLTSQSGYTNTLIDDSYYTTAYDLDGVITVDGEPMDGLYKDKKILYTDNGVIYLGDEYKYGDGKYAADYDYEGSYEGTIETTEVKDYVYIRYPDADNNDEYAWVCVNNSKKKEFEDLKTSDFENIDSSNIIYTTGTTLAVDDEFEISGVTVTVTNFVNNAGYMPQGKGVVYYLKDEFNNEADFDFKNIIFKMKLNVIRVADIHAEGTNTYLYKNYIQGNIYDGAGGTLYAYVRLYNSKNYTIAGYLNEYGSFDFIELSEIIYFTKEYPISDLDSDSNYYATEEELYNDGLKFTFGFKSETPLDNSFYGNCNNNSIKSNIENQVKYLPVLDLKDGVKNYSNKPQNIWCGTMNMYNQLEYKDSNILYLIF